MERKLGPVRHSQLCYRGQPAGPRPVPTDTITVILTVTKSLYGALGWFYVLPLPTP